MLASIWNRLITLINQIGYPGFFVASFLENLIPPIPSEVIMPLGWYLASTGKLNLIWVIIVCTLWSTIWNLPWYVVGRYFSKKKIKKFVEKYGKYFFYKPEYVDDIYKTFDNNQRKIIFLGRFVPGARWFLGIPAGSAKMNFGLFFWYTLAGTLIWSSFLVLLGYYVWENRSIIVDWVSKYDHYMIYVVALLLIWFVIYIARKRRSKNTDKNDPIDDIS